MSEESRLEQTDVGIVPKTDGWFVLNARDAPWRERPERGAFCEFEASEDGCDFHQLGVNLQSLGPGEPMAMYHWEQDQEDFLILAGEAVLVVEGEERPLRQWDFVHCPSGTKHVIVGAGEGRCLVLCVGARAHQDGSDWGGYTVDAAASKHGAGVDEDTSDPAVAYARFTQGRWTRFRDEWLPE